ncbi:MAG TPA: SDR family oxidoreductase [Roseiflexaceae bacterium]|nr:SDR family oxidoreductase [Roseiflexaceae bacterium]
MTDFSPEELEICLRVLQRVADDPGLVQEHERFKSLVAKIHKGGKKGERRAAQSQRRAEDRALSEAAVLVQRQSGVAAPALPEQAGGEALGELRSPRDCYICKRPYTRLHVFYHLLCPDCAALNYQKRQQRADLSGRTALLTGGRVKIGYQTALRLLRDGARVILTTRFPRDAARRFAAEPDSAAWADRLAIYGLDLRHIPAVEQFARLLLEREPALDILINNAAQTIKRPLDFYRHLLEGEGDPPERLPASQRALLAPDPPDGPALLERLPGYRGHLPGAADYFPPETFDLDGQQVDLRPDNSWVQRLDQVGTVELLEVQLVNAVAPFILCARLKPLLLRSPFARRFIVNVSAMEGQFARETKTANHPHTNMAKAALNMLTRTSAADYAADGIFMNSVDTGWITDENPFPRRAAQEQRGFYPPLDLVDGVARIYDPIVQGVARPETPLFGLFLKNYAPYPW